MQFEDPKSILEAAAAKPTRDLDAPALMKKARGLRRARLTAAAAGVAVVVAAATASFGLIAGAGDPGPGPAGRSSADCDEDDTKCLAELTCWNPPPFEVSIFLHDDAAPDEVAELRAEILADPEVGEVVHFSRKEAFAEFRKIYADQPELWETIPPDALPASLRISASTVEAVDRIHGITSPIVDEIHSGLEFRRRLCGDEMFAAPSFTPSRDQAEQTAPQEGPVRVTLHHCGVDPVLFAGREWVVLDPPFDATNAPRGFSGGGRMEVLSEKEARYVDSSGIALHFRAVESWEPPPCN